MAKPYFKLGQLLINEGLLTQAQLDKAIELQKKSPGQSLGQILVKSGVITENDLVPILSKQLDIPYASEESGLLKPADDPELIKILPEAFARKHQTLPLHRNLNYLTVAVTDPMDLMLLDNLRKVTGYNIRAVIATSASLERAIDKCYGEGGLLKSAIAESYRDVDPAADKKLGEDVLLGDMVKTAEKTPVIQLTDLILQQAAKDRASDIHIEPFADKISLRFRIDGVLHEISPPNRNLMVPLISRLKILSRMDIAEKRLPQDGSFNAVVGGHNIDFRVSTIPTIYGEKMVLRILDKSAMNLDLGKVGFEKEELGFYREAIHKPYGLILITGPTGSGKTTTLYAALNELNGTDKNIVTIEDPVEYKIPGINQVQVKQTIGLNFASALRSFLRQDPDVILVGETRDVETAQICVRAALTGHLVFTTLHTNDAPSSINRLIDIGVEPFFVSSSILLVVAQRLVRRLCDQCKEAYKPAGNLPKNFHAPTGVIYRPKGCEQCAKTGYRGRIAIFEIMRINERIQELISQKASMMLIRMEARKAGMVSLEENGYRKVAAGFTSLEEIIRVTMPVD